MRILLVTLITLVLHFSAFSQECIATIDSFIDNGNYEVRGTVHIEKDQNGKLYINALDDFFATRGPDLYFVFLTNNTSATSDGNKYFVVEDTIFRTVVRGPFTVPVPDTLSIDDYNFLALQCKGAGYIHWGGGAIEECALTTANKTIAKPEGIAIYPVPAESLLNVDINNKDVTSYEVFDIKGSRIFKYGSEVESFYVTDLQPGIYNIKFNLKNNQFYTQRFTVN